MTTEEPLYVSDLTEWSPLAEIKAVITSEVPEENGYWEVVWGPSVWDFPSLAELFEWMTENRHDLQHRGKLMSIAWVRDH